MKNWTEITVYRYQTIGRVHGPALW